MKLTDLHDYKDAYKIYKILLNPNHPNIILYSPKSYDKTNLIKNTLNIFFNINKNKINTENIYYEYNDFYYYFNFKSIKYDKKTLFFNLLKKIVQSYNYYKNTYNYIILDNYNNINPGFEFFLRVFIEKNYNSKFILLSSNTNKIMPSIISRCLCIRLSTNNNDKIKVEHTNKYLDCYEIIINKIMKLIYTKLNKKISGLKELSYNILSSTIDINILFNKLLNNFISQDIDNMKKYKLIKFIAECNHDMIKSYKELIFIEFFLLNIYKILNE